MRYTELAPDRFKDFWRYGRSPPRATPPRSAPCETEITRRRTIDQPR
jgi:hypothetical protein